MAGENLVGRYARLAMCIARTGEGVTVRQAAFCRTVKVLGLGERRGPAAEARLLYEEIAAPVHQPELMPAWDAMQLGDEERHDDFR